MRIAYLNPSGKLGGAETSLREMLAGVRAAEPDWDLWLVLGEDGPLAAVARELGVRVVLQPFPPELASLGDAAGTMSFRSLAKAAAPAMAYSRILARVLDEIQPDIIHTNGLKMHLLGARVRPKDTPLIWHIHDYVSSRRLMSRLLRLFRRSCHGALANSNSVAEDLRALMPGLRVTTIYNAVDLTRYSPDGSRIDLDRLAGLTPARPGTVRVGLVATFARWKGHKVFLEALARLAPDAPVRGYIVGGPIYQTAGSQWSQEELAAFARDLNLGDRIGFTGFLQDPAAAMRSLDVIVHASTQPEPFGMVIIEAMATGKAVIASGAGGATELFVEDQDAVSHPPGDAAALARQIERLSANAALRSEIGGAGRAKAERLFGRGRLAADLLGFYRGVVGGSAPKSDLPLETRLRAVDHSGS